MRRSTNSLLFIRQAEFTVRGSEAAGSGFAVASCDRCGIVLVSSGNTLSLIRVNELEQLFDSADAPQSLPADRVEHQLPREIVALGVSATNELLSVQYASMVDIFFISDLLDAVSMLKLHVDIYLHLIVEIGQSY